MYRLKPSRPWESLPPFWVIWIYSHQLLWGQKLASSPPLPDKLSTLSRPSHAENHQSHKSRKSQNHRREGWRDECRLWHGCVTVVLCCWWWWWWWWWWWRAYGWDFTICVTVSANGFNYMLLIYWVHCCLFIELLKTQVGIGLTGVRGMLSFKNAKRRVERTDSGCGIRRNSFFSPWVWSKRCMAMRYRTWYYTYVWSSNTCVIKYLANSVICTV